jgi:hypothetical protein
MRKMMVGFACVVALIGGALAQEQAPAPERPAVRFDAMPDLRDFMRNYPRPARQRAIPGVASLCCTINPDRTLSCQVASEWPEGYGFGQASLNVAREFRVFEDSYRDAEAAGDLSVRRTLRWVLANTSTQNARLADEAADIARVAACPVLAPAPVGQ